MADGNDAPAKLAHEVFPPVKQGPIFGFLSVPTWEMPKPVGLSRVDDATWKQFVDKLYAAWAEHVNPALKDMALGLLIVPIFFMWGREGVRIRALLVEARRSADELFAPLGIRAECVITTKMGSYVGSAYNRGMMPVVKVTFFDATTQTH
mmetsp:Transcript_11918/g.36278  ORF Transcript_11918/g.36278 Transcript_11918/m.36278 type:complete len:150 (-) Transcript_11918:17-466(-)